MFKQIIILRKDLGMSPGKECVQCAHACLGAYERTDKSIIKKWKSEGHKKVVLEVNSKEKILELKEKAKKQDISYFLVEDAGLTELKPGTITALGIGPDEEEKMDEITGSLPLL